MIVGNDVRPDLILHDVRRSAGSVRCCQIDDFVPVHVVSAVCREVRQPFKLARSQMGALCSRVDVAHLRDLLIAFRNIGLVDADSVYQVGAKVRHVCCRVRLHEKVLQVLANLARLAVDQDHLRWQGGVQTYERQL